MLQKNNYRWRQSPSMHRWMLPKIATGRSNGPNVQSRLSYYGTWMEPKILTHTVKKCYCAFVLDTVPALDGQMDEFVITISRSVCIACWCTIVIRDDEHFSTKTTVQAPTAHRFRASTPSARPRRLRRLVTIRPYSKILDPPLTLSNANGDISQKDKKMVS